MWLWRAPGVPAAQSATGTVLQAACAPLVVVGRLWTFDGAVKQSRSDPHCVQTQQRGDVSEAPLIVSECLSHICTSIWVTVWASLAWHGSVRTDCFSVC